MRSHLRRLLTAGAAYQLAEAVSKVIALVLLPVYTRYLTPADYGTAELMLTSVILASIVVRLGIGEAFVRFHFHDEDPARRLALARTATGVLFATTAAAALAAAVLAVPLSELLLGREDAAVVRAAALGLWAFTNLELAYALLRVREDARAYVVTSLSNVVLTVALTVWLVVVREEGALGLVLGNFAASAGVLAGLWWARRDQLGWWPGRMRPALLGPMLRYGLPTVPAEISVFALFVVDRFWLYRAESEEAAGLYSLSVKLAAIVIFTVRAFQLAWPPLAYSVRDEQEAARLYARVATYYVLFTGIVVVALTLLGRWVLRVLDPDFFPAFAALPWVALGWSLYGLYLVLVAMAGRAHVTVRTVPPALAGLTVNVALLVLLVEPLGIAGAGLALVGSYLVMLAVLHRLTRTAFPVPFEWERLALIAGVAGGLCALGELLLPEAGAVGLAGRLGVLAAVPVVLGAAGFFAPGERAAARALLGRVGLTGAPRG